VGAGGGYAAVLDNLRLHDPRYPSVEHLNSLIKIGNISYRGEMQKDTEGSEFIKQALLDDDPRPVFLQVWGGTNTVAAALRSIEDEYKGTRRWRSVYKRVVSKARLYVILDQDETYKDYIDPHWPDIDVVMNRDQFWTVAYFRYRYSGIRGLPRVPDEIENAYFKPPFIQKLRFGPCCRATPSRRTPSRLGRSTIRTPRSSSPKATLPATSGCSTTGSAAGRTRPTAAGVDGSPR
jgi:hypothetical protein